MSILLHSQFHILTNNYNNYNHLLIGFGPITHTHWLSHWMSHQFTPSQSRSLTLSPSLLLLILIRFIKSWSTIHVLSLRSLSVMSVKNWNDREALHSQFSQRVPHFLVSPYQSYSIITAKITKKRWILILVWALQAPSISWQTQWNAERRLQCRLVYRHFLANHFAGLFGDINLCHCVTVTVSFAPSLYA